MSIDIDPGSDPVEAAALLRHDLITPVNHILGYCDLLVDDAEENGRIYRLQSLRVVRTLGKEALGAIDRALARALDGDGPAEIASLGRALLAPSAAIVEACNAMAEASSGASDGPGFLDDLAKIREAGARLVLIAEQMVADPAVAIAG